MKKVRVDVISRDCSPPSDTYFGYYQMRTRTFAKIAKAWKDELREIKD